MPFSHRHKSFQLHCPKVMDQGNGYDCGVHVCRYAYNLVQMVDLKVKNKDFTDNFASCISCHDLFDYNADDINRLRSQMHDLIVHVTSLYRNHRDTVIDCLNESDDEDDEDDVEIMYPVTQTSDDSSESNSESSFSQLDDDDDDLSADTTGDLDQIHYRTDKTYNYIDLDCNLAHDDGDADSSDLNVFVQLGDIIEYRSSKKDAPMKGQIVSIGALSSDRILQVSDGKWLSRKVHQVKRIEIVRPLEDKRLVNPSPMWKGLDKVVVIPPFETVDEVDEVDGVVENDINSGETTTTADTTSPGSAESIATSDEPTAGTNQVEEEEEQIPFDVCVGAHVCLESANIDPNSGLYVSAIGVVVEIVYDKDHSVGPNGKGEVSLPKYIVVDFPTYKPPPGEDPWDKNNPTHLAINDSTKKGKKRRRIMRSQVITSQLQHLAISKMDHCTILQKKTISHHAEYDD